MIENNKENPTKNPIWGVITASSVGTLIEWYDFYIFGSLAAMGIIGKQFSLPTTLRLHF